MSRKGKVTLKVNRGGDLNRYIHLVVDYPTSINQEIQEIFYEIKGSIRSLNNDIKKSINTYEEMQNLYSPSRRGYVQFKHSYSVSDNDKGDFDDDELNNYRALVNFSSHDIMFEKFFGNENGITHVIYICSDKNNLTNNDALLSGFNQIVQCKISREVVFNILHDIALDIYFFRAFFQDVLRSINDLELINRLRDFSTSKVDFARQVSLNFYGILAAEFFGTNPKLSYFCFASSVRLDIASSDLNFQNYYNIWIEFQKIFYHEISLSRMDTKEEVVQFIANFIFDIKKFGGQISPVRLKRNLTDFLESSTSDSGSNSLIFVVVNKRPRSIKDREYVASLFGRRKWRRNLWIIVNDIEIPYFSVLFPYVRLIKINIPPFVNQR
jgi:hypothetical protein